jgi:hypothetical protein
LLGDFLYAPHFHFIIIIIFIWVCLKSCFLSVNLWDKWIGILVDCLRFEVVCLLTSLLLFPNYILFWWITSKIGLCFWWSS